MFSLHKDSNIMKQPLPSPPPSAFGSPPPELSPHASASKPPSPDFLSLSQGAPSSPITSINEKENEEENISQYSQYQQHLVLESTSRTGLPGTEQLVGHPRGALETVSVTVLAWVVARVKSLPMKATNCVNVKDVPRVAMEFANEGQAPSRVMGGMKRALPNPHLELSPSKKQKVENSRVQLRRPSLPAPPALPRYIYNYSLPLVHPSPKQDLSHSLFPPSQPTDLSFFSPSSPSKLHEQPRSLPADPAENPDPVVFPPDADPGDSWSELERAPATLHHLHDHDVLPDGRYHPAAHPKRSRVLDLVEDRFTLTEGDDIGISHHRWVVAPPGPSTPSHPNAWRNWRDEEELGDSEEEDTKRGPSIGFDAMLRDERAHQRSLRQAASAS
ncbi:hypothetical protein T439DRAFT_197233 [Meredithblackwellia eburnea MCA 4105]